MGAALKKGRPGDLAKIVSEGAHRSSDSSCRERTSALKARIMRNNEHCLEFRAPLHRGDGGARQTDFMRPPAGPRRESL